jgi:hypothetical protein
MHKTFFLFLALTASFAAGASLDLRPAAAETAAVPPAGPWQLSVAGGGTPAAWRLNTATGFMELCSAAGGTPRCDAMPAPGAAATSPKGFLVPAPSGR